MLQLTDADKRLLDGSHGRFRQKAMEVMVAFAKALGAERFCPISKASLFCGAHGYVRALQNADADRVLSEMCFASQDPLGVGDTPMSCSCQTEVYPFDREHWSEMGFTLDDYEKNELYLQKFMNAGVHIVGSCIPYLTGFVPLMGENYVACESHAILLMNSIWGARGNVNGIEVTFCAAACGRVPYAGHHVPENRRGQYLFFADTPIETRQDWDLLGYTIGRMMPPGTVPVLSGSFPRPTIVDLKAYYAAMATSGGAEMAHIVGITPEARDLNDAFGGQKPLEKFHVTRDDLQESLEMLCAPEEDELQFISLGCPHYALDEIAFAANRLKGKKVAPGVELQIWTSPSIKICADNSGYSALIEEAGGKLYTCSCPTTHGNFPDGVRAMAYDSCRQAHSNSPITDAVIYCGTAAQCLDAAVRGTWR